MSNVFGIKIRVDIRDAQIDVNGKDLEKISTPSFNVPDDDHISSREKEPSVLPTKAERKLKKANITERRK